jgi:murein L,D-transpeptidase YcbB/YkuD
MTLAILLLSLDLGSLLRIDVVAGERMAMAPAVRTFYARRAQQPAWDAASLVTLRRAIDALENDGLTPAHYHRAALAHLPEGAERDILATDAFLLAAEHLSRGVVDPQFARPSWCIAPGPLDLAAVLQAALDEQTIEESLARLTTQHEGYARLRSALAAYRVVERGGGWPLVSAGRSLRLGDDDPRVAELRARLGASPGTRFDDELDTLVRHFQSHHGIAADGVAGPETLRELNVSAADRVRQIAANMERWRWMPDDLGDAYVIVNIAAFRLDVIERGQSVLAMKTIVGRRYTRTPFFAARILDVQINPWWNVPDSIAMSELWPKQKRDPTYLARNQMIVVDGRIRQRPGPWNALGRLKFNLPNPYDVYLHDTPSRSLFARPVRAFSHGCIRLEHPRDLAAYLLRDQPQWTASAIQEAIDSGRERRVPLTSPMPVYVLYWTAWIGDDGHMEFHRDHYARDTALIEALR